MIRALFLAPLLLAVAGCGRSDPTPEASDIAAGETTAAPAETAGAPQRAPATASQGMVSSAHPLATDAGVRILEAGGNAFDAAVAVAAALNVVEPMMSGIGGYGTILVYEADSGQSRFLNSSGRIPAALDSDVFRPPTPGYMENRRGAKSVSTPGNVNAWGALAESGNLEWSVLFDDAIRYAEDGYLIDERIAALIGNAFDDFPDHAKAFYGKDGEPLAAGDRLVQADLGTSLRMIAAGGPGVFHGGALGEAVDRAMRDAGSFLRLADLADNEPEWWGVIDIDYRGYRVVTAPPPANSFPALVRLGLMAQFDLASMGHNTVDYLHYFAEATKHAFWTRLAYAGDPDIAPPPLERLLSDAYFADQAATIGDTATDFEPPGVMPTAGQNTTHYVVADRWGNVVSATQTLGNSFGSRLMPEGTGIWLNNSLAYSTFEPKGNPMDAYPGRRKLSGDVPLFVMRDDRPWIVIGTPGGHTIGQTVPQIVMNVLDFGMDIQTAIDAPRVSFIEPNDLAVEPGIDAAVVEALIQRGHHIVERTRIGNAHGLTIDYASDGKPVAFAGGADSRGSGTARGL
ncbi:MAG: gamma-glutamyltransferase [Woeseiaceae bacterium]|nr:gamma-glutamyltransferase [Woeseiaceae bacterium]